MSYIRCLSNPEKLYVWSDGRTVHLTWNVKYPLSSPDQNMIVPKKSFEKALKKWRKTDETTEVSGFKIEEEYIYLYNGRKVVDKKFSDKRKTAFLYKLSYKGKFVYLWRVTLWYMSGNVSVC